MKAAGISKCRPGGSRADMPAGQRPAPAHMPIRRAVATSSLYFSDGASDEQVKAVWSSTHPLDALVLHRPLERTPHVLHIDKDSASALALAVLLMPEVRVTHVPTLAAARQMLQRHIFSAVVIDPNLPDGDAEELLPELTAIPLLVYSANQPSWRERTGEYLPKPWTSPRQLWTAISRLLGIPTSTCVGD